MTTDTTDQSHLGQRHLGIVNAWLETKGYGFIRHATEDFRGRIVKIQDRNRRDVFCHVKEAQRSGLGDIAEGDAVSFAIVIDRTGREKAADLQRIEQANETEPKAAA